MPVFYYKNDKISFKLNAKHINKTIASDPWIAVIRKIISSLLKFAVIYDPGI